MDESKEKEQKVDAAVNGTKTNGSPEVSEVPEGKPRLEFVDHGWAWMILLGAVIQMFISVGTMKCSGIFFVEIQKRFSSTSSETAAISSVQNGVYSLTSLFVMTLGMKVMSCRISVFIGSTIIATAFIITSFMNQISILYFSFGVLQGFGLAFIMGPSLAMIGQYFDARRGLANSIAVSGASLGGLVMAPLLNFLFEMYAYSGTMLIVGSIILNCWITGALFRPISFYNLSRKATRSEKHVPLLQEAHENHTLSEQFANMPRSSLERKQRQLERTFSHPPLLVRTISEKERSKKRSDGVSPDGSNQSSPFSFQRAISFAGYGRPRAFTNASTISRTSNIVDAISQSAVARCLSTEFVCTSNLELAGGFLSTEDNSGAHISNTRGCIAFMTRLFHTLFDMSLTKNPIFIVLILSQSFFIGGLGLIPVFLAPYARDMGLTAKEISLLYTIMGAIDVTSRIVFGFIADKELLDRSYMTALGATIVGLASHFISFYTSFGSIVAFAVVYALFGGIYFSLFAVILVDFLGIDKLQSALGFTVLMNGVVIASLFPVIGSLRDASGSYMVPFHLLGTLLFVGSLLSCLAACLHKSRNQGDAQITREDPELQSLN